MTMLADFRAGRLAPVAPCPRDAGPAPGVAGTDRAAGREARAPGLADVGAGAAGGWLGLLGWWRGKNAPAQVEEWEESPPTWSTADLDLGEENTPTPALARFAGVGREADQRANGTDSAVGYPLTLPLPSGVERVGCDGGSTGARLSPGQVDIFRTPAPTSPRPSPPQVRAERERSGGPVRGSQMQLRCPPGAKPGATTPPQRGGMRPAFAGLFRPTRVRFKKRGCGPTGFARAFCCDIVICF